jgi:hypothetical protein
MKRLPEAIWLAYNEDAVRCVKRRHPNASLPWYYHGPIPAEWCAELVQEYFEQAQGLTRQDRVKHALLSYAKQRELFVTISIEKGSQERCRESIIRKMPFLCFFGTPDNPRVYAACGYAQMDGRFYLLALDSEKYRPNYATASKIWSPNDTTPGLVVLDADPGTCTCMFIYNWCHDEKALEERIVRFLAEHKDAKEKPAKPLPEGPTTQEPAR